MYKQLYMSVDIEITTMVRTQVIQPLSAVQKHPSSALSQIFNFSHCSVTLNIAGNHSSQASVGQSMLSYQIISSFRIWLRFRCIVQINTFWTFLLFAATIDRLQFNWIKPCNVVNCTLRIKCSLDLLVSYVCFDICGGIEKASSRGHRARMQSPQKFCLLSDE